MDPDRVNWTPNRSQNVSSRPASMRMFFLRVPDRCNSLAKLIASIVWLGMAISSTDSRLFGHLIVELVLGHNRPELELFRTQG